MPPASRIIELDPADVSARLARNEAVLVDVREPAEFAAEHIAGAVSMPLSTFDPAALPGGDPSRIVFSCQGGKRSAIAAMQCAAAGVAASTHLRGGLAAWKAARLPTTR